MSRIIAWIALVCLVGACGSPQRTAGDSGTSDATTKQVPDTDPKVPDAELKPDAQPPQTMVDAAVQPTMRRNGDGPLSADARFEHLTPRTQWPLPDAYGNLLVEGNNSGMRGDADASGAYPITGVDIAERWRAWGRATRGVFLLRDSLWNQQDHAGRYAPVALMLSPSWVTIAVHEAALGNPPPRLGIPADPNDDAAWMNLELTELFGPFPPSDTLHAWATQSMTSTDPGSASRIMGSRETLIVLDTLLGVLSDAARAGPQAVANAGAEVISQSDRDYFGAELRRDAFIPLLVENPYPHELHDEGKSFRVSGRDVPDDIIALTRTTVLRRRLADGDMAIERYDLSDPSAIDHLVDVLSPLIPEGETGNTVWIWVTGPVETEGEWIGPPALDYRDALETALSEAAIERDRVQVVTRNPRALNSKTDIDVLRSEIAAHGDAGWTLRLNMRAAVLERKLQALQE